MSWISIPIASSSAAPVATATGNALTVSGGILGSSAAAVIAAPIAVIGSYYIASDLYDRYVSKDDAAILYKITTDDCGDLSKMIASVKGCYKKYVTEATHRLAQKPGTLQTVEKFYDRIRMCFENNKLSLEPCSWNGWWNWDAKI